MDDRIQRLANEITQKVQPDLKGQDMSIVIPAFIQVTLNMAMFGMDCGPRRSRRPDHRGPTGCQNRRDELMSAQFHL